MVILLNRVPTIKRNNTMFLTAGFFASKTIGVDFDPLQAMNNYGMRDEQEKCFALQKGPLGHDRLRTWSEGGKRGRMFIYFVGLILASYVRSVWQKDDVLRKKFSSTDVVLQSTSPRLSQQSAKEVARLSRKWKNKSFRCTKLKNSDYPLRSHFGSWSKLRK